MEISLEKAKKEKLFYFVATGVIYRARDKRCLILKRSLKEKVHPGKWGFTGGKLEWQDLRNNKPDFTSDHILGWWDNAIEKLVLREALEESGLVVGDSRYLFSGAYVRPDNIPVVMVKFAVKYKSGEVKIPVDFDEYAWVNEEEAKNYDLIGDLLHLEISKAITIYSRS